MDFLMVNDGSFLGTWSAGSVPIYGMILAVVSAILVIFLTGIGQKRLILKCVVGACAVASIPLGLEQVGFDIQLNNHEVSTYLNFLGTVLAVVIAVPYMVFSMINSLSRGNNSLGSTTGTAFSTQGSTNQGGGSLDSSSNTLTFTAGPRNGETVDVGSQTLTIGRSPDNDIVIDDPTVSRHHARVTLADGTYRIEDLGSNSGTKVDGSNVESDSLRPGASIKLGNTEFQFATLGGYTERFPSSPVSTSARSDQNATRIISEGPSSSYWLAITSGQATGSTYQLSEGVNFIGRQVQDGFSIDDQYISRRHAMIRVSGSDLSIYDVGSTGGTKLNGTEIGGAVVNHDAVIKIGQTELRLISVDNPRQFADATMSGRTMVDRSGEKVGALVVVSGVDAGKSYLLCQGENSVGRQSGSDITINDDSVSREHAVLRCQDGKVILHDVGSTSGTLLNGQRIGGIAIKPGDVVSVGRTELTVMAPGK
jgi:pSer/pThr/pTyr-binding forkhead associated (FHA) protein